MSSRNRWFLSYHSPDRELASRLKEAIERKDAQAQVFVAATQMRAGSFWSAQIAQEIAHADGFILLVGEHGLGDWQVLEYNEALDKGAKNRDFPIVLVLLSGQVAPGLPFLRGFHWIVSQDPSSDEVAAQVLDARLGGN